MSGNNRLLACFAKVTIVTMGAVLIFAVFGLRASSFGAWGSCAMGLGAFEFWGSETLRLFGFEALGLWGFGAIEYYDRGEF